jgi:hypothetical protein
MRILLRPPQFHTAGQEPEDHGAGQAVPARLRRVGEGVVEGVEGAVMVDCDFEAAPRARVLHGDSHCVIPWMPEELNVDTIALARGELAAGARPAGC